MSLGIAMTPPDFNGWGPAVCERNTFLDFSPPVPALVRAKTASALEEEVFSAPPLLPLEFCETPDAFSCPQLLAAAPAPQEDTRRSLDAKHTMHQKNTFWEVKPPVGPPELRRAKTDPPPGLEDAMSEPDAEDSEQEPAPPMLPLDYMQTPDALSFPLNPGTPSNSQIILPPGLPAVTLESSLPCFAPIMSQGQGLDAAFDDDFACFAGPPPLPLEKFDTFDDFEPSQLPLEKVREDWQPSYLPLERIAVLSDERPISPSEENLEQAEDCAMHRQQINLQEAIPESMAGGSFGLPAMPPPPPMIPAPVLHEDKTCPAPLAAPLEGDAMPPASADMRPGALVCRSSGNGASYVHWVVDGKKLFSTDVRIVSTQFELDLPGHGLQPFKVTLHPKLVINNKRGGGFKKAKGKGSVMLKCESHVLESAPLLEFSIRVGRGSMLQPPRGPVRNNFAEKSLCGLPDGQEEWDFRALVDESDLLLISLQIGMCSGSQ